MLQRTFAKRVAMMRLGTIITAWVLLSACVLGCEAQTRYRVLCHLFDGVPPPHGVAPCDGGPGGVAVAGGGRASRGKESSENKAAQYTEHGPYAAKLCDGCHQRQTNQLILPVEELCFNCHVFPLDKRKVHGPLASGGCIICHNPHGSGNRFLLVSDSQGFCLYCHRREDVSGNEAHQGLDEACTTCHNAHASDNDHLLR